VAIGPFRCWSSAFLCRCCTAWQLRKSARQIGDEDYYLAQYMWPADLKYHMDQFLYRQLHKADPNTYPEFLEADSDHVSKVDDVKAHMGDAVRQTAESTSRKRGRNKRREGRAFVGGKVVDVADGTGVRLTEYSSQRDGSAPACECIRPGCKRPTWNGKPGTFCGRTCRDKATKGPTMDGVLLDPERGVDATAVVPIILPDTVGRPAKARGRWEYATGQGFTSFAEDCQETLEEKYQLFRNGTGSDRVIVNTAGHNISVDFGQMTQMVEGKHKVRKIQRKDQE